MAESYILNVTFHVEHSALRDVGYFLQHRLLPSWRVSWGNVLLLELPDDAGFALQISGDDLEVLSSIAPGDDPDVQKILSVYPGLVTFFPTLLKVLA